MGRLAGGMSAPEIIVDSELMLRGWRHGDAEAALRAILDPETVRWNPVPAVVDLDSAHEWIDRGADWSQGGHASFAVVSRADDALLGSVSMYGITDEREDASVGYWTAPHARGRGVAARAVDAVSRWAFTTMPMVRITLCHSVGNEASCRVALAAGYQLEGLTRQSYRYGDGVRHDEHLHARIVTDVAPAAARRAGRRSAAESPAPR
jgi:RimJ/RimL family protein N-acetyltransferase